MVLRRARINTTERRSPRTTKKNITTISRAPRSRSNIIFYGGPIVTEPICGGGVRVKMTKKKEIRLTVIISSRTSSSVRIPYAHNTPRVTHIIIYYCYINMRCDICVFPPRCDDIHSVLRCVRRVCEGNENARGALVVAVHRAVFRKTRDAAGLGVCNRADRERALVRRNPLRARHFFFHAHVRIYIYLYKRIKKKRDAEKKTLSGARRR